MDIPQTEWMVRHTLDRITLELEFPRHGETVLKASGYSATKRGRLWHLEERWGAVQSDLPAHDAIAHLALVCLQDRPRSEEQLGRSLRGGALWEEVELPWS